MNLISNHQDVARNSLSIFDHREFRSKNKATTDSETACNIGVSGSSLEAKKRIP